MVNGGPLAEELRRLDALILVALDRLRARYALSLDELRGLHITHERVDALLQPPVDVAGRRAVPDVQAFRAADTASRWFQLAGMLELDDDERDLLLVCLAPELDAKYETLFAYLHDDVTRRRPSVELVVRVLARDAAHEHALRGRLLPGARLFACGALDVGPGAPESSRATRPLYAAPPLADWLRGLAYVDERLSRVARFGSFASELPDAGVPAAARGMLEACTAAIRAGADVPPLVVTASTASEALVLAEDAVARAGRVSLVVDLAALRAAPSAGAAAAALRLAQQVLGVAVVAGPLDALVDGDGRPVEASLSAVRRLMAESPACLLAAGRGARVADLIGDVACVHVRVPDLAPRERAAVWRAACDDETLPEAEALADRFALGVDRIAHAAASARAVAALHGRATPSGGDLFAAARQASFDGSGGVTRLVSTSFEWADLIVPGAVQQRLQELVRAIEVRSRVLDTWGFARTVGDARGIKAMFAGPSGTGKTMAAALVAKTLGVPMARIELGTVVSKYIGETEKNLDRAFDAARRANAILFIDEADALLGRRAQVKDAHDRYANVEVAYLLQKMEDHDGVVVVATNLAQNIDDAFSRRMQFVIEFSMPDSVCRQRLWRSMLPAAAPVAPDLDVAFLARQFDLAGGDIRNVVLDAAYRAAHDGCAISLGHLLRAIAHHYAKHGRVPTAADFREHFALLAQEPLSSEAAAVPPHATHG